MFYPYLPNAGFSINSQAEFDVIMAESRLFYEKMQHLFYGFSIFFISASMLMFFSKKFKKHSAGIILILLSAMSAFFAYSSTRGYSWYFDVSHRVYTVGSLLSIASAVLAIFLFKKFKEKNIKEAKIVPLVVICVFSFLALMIQLWPFVPVVLSVYCLGLIKTKSQRSRTIIRLLSIAIFVYYPVFVIGFRVIMNGNSTSPTSVGLLIYGYVIIVLWIALTVYFFRSLRSLRK